MRKRATRHCKECGMHVCSPWPRSPHFCWQNYRKITASAVRTSPDWCPQGHILPGVPYPTFTPGRDPYAVNTRNV